MGNEEPTIKLIGLGNKPVPKVTETQILPKQWFALITINQDGDTETSAYYAASGQAAFDAMLTEEYEKTRDPLEEISDWYCHVTIVSCGQSRPVIFTLKG